MSKFVDKLTSALGISRAYDDETEDFDEYDPYDQYDEEPKERSGSQARSASRSTRSSSYSSSREGSSSYESSSSRRYGSRSYGSSESSYSGSSRYERPQTAEAPRESARISSVGATSLSAPANYSRLRNSKVVNLNANIQMEVVMVNPESLEEARDIAMQIKDRKPVVINLEFAEPIVAQRITDLLCGCCYALNGNIQRVSDKIFMIAPDTVGFAGDLDIREKLQSENGLMFPWQEQ